MVRQTFGGVCDDVYEGQCSVCARGSNHCTDWRVVWQHHGWRPTLLLPASCSLLAGGRFLARPGLLLPRHCHTSHRHSLW